MIPSAGRAYTHETLRRCLTCTVPFFSVQCKAILTNTAEAPDAVAARSVVAQAVEDLTFIHIWGGQVQD